MTEVGALELIVWRGGLKGIHTCMYGASPGGLAHEL